MTSSDLPPQGDAQQGPPPAAQPGAQEAAPGVTAVDDGPRVTRDDITDLGRLRRSRTDRHVAGVSGGLARHLDIDPIIVRVAFVVTAFFGGAGLFAYGALWLLVPEEGEDHAPVNLDEKARGVALIVIGVLAAIALLGGTWGGNWFPWPLALVALLAWFMLNRRHERRMRHGTVQQGWVPAVPTAEPAQAQAQASSYDASYSPPQYSYVPSPRPRDPRKGGPILFWFTLALIALALGTLGIVQLSGVDVVDSAYPALAVGITGVMLAVGAFWGRAGGLILLGLLITVPLVVTTVISNIDDRTVVYSPDTAAEVQARYWNDAGEMTVDLTDVADPDELDGRSVVIEGGAGRINVIVPPGVTVTAEGTVDGPGSVEVFGQETGGIDTTISGSRSAGADQPTIDVDAKLGVGQIIISQ
ncbi:PspC domain-containing protein [Nocardioides sp. LHG3406-4]|uniref:PspC domain-containing protein n=1 Tax=Nocardioides sp. LHG3406-4 TaxID=2804575 RepID=UPI003CF18283